MSDRPTTPPAAGEDADPVVAAALRTLVPPPHRPGFWDAVDARLGARAEPAGAAQTGPVALASELPAPESSAAEPPAAEPPLAEVVPLAPSRLRGWWLAVAAALVLVVAAATLLRSPNTDLEITPADPTTVPEPPTSLDPSPDPGPALDPTRSSSTGPGPVAPATSAATTPSSTASRGTSTTKPASLTLSPSGVGPLQLGMTTSQARATGAVGGYTAQNEGCGFAKPAGSYRTGDFSALFLNGRLARIYVQPGSRLRTPQGIGVGSPASRLGAVPGTRVDSPEKYGAGTDVTITSGGVGYRFRIDGATVREWSVGTREGLGLSEGCS